VILLLSTFIWAYIHGGLTLLPWDSLAAEKLNSKLLKTVRTRVEVQ